MLYPISDDLRRRRLIVPGIAITLLTLAFIAYVVQVRHGRTTYAPISSTEGSPIQPTPTMSKPAATELPSLKRTSDPETFAREVARSLFSWDTTTMIGRSDHIERLLTVGDPIGESTVGLLADLGAYLPTDSAWRDLAQYETMQWLSIASVTRPAKWAEAETQAGDQLAPGTTALTIEATRHRAGIWEGARVSSEHDVAFTVFIVCRPSYSACRLLRLSVLDKPLD